MDTLRQLEIERACERLVAGYATVVDRRNNEGLADLFTDDAVIEGSGTARRGRAAIAAPRPPGPAMLMRHLCSNVVVEVVDEQHATGHCYLTAYVQPAEDLVLDRPAVVGEYFDDFRLTPHGWRIAHRRFVPTIRRAP